MHISECSVGHTCCKLTCARWDRPVSGVEALDEVGARKRSQVRPLRRGVYQRAGEIEKVQRKEALMQLVVVKVYSVETVRKEMIDVYKRGWGELLLLESPLAENCCRRRCR